MGTAFRPDPRNIIPRNDSAMCLYANPNVTITSNSEYDIATYHAWGATTGTIDDSKYIDLDKPPHDAWTTKGYDRAPFTWRAVPNPITTWWIDGYKITADGFKPGMCCKDWEFRGVNKDGTTTLIEKRSGFTSWGKEGDNDYGASKQFNLEHPVRFFGYELYITDQNDDEPTVDHMVIGEIEFLGYKPIYQPQIV